MFNKRPIRRAQLISPFGVGAMVDFPHDESLMPAGLDAWPLASESVRGTDWFIQEERLQARLGVDHFRLPPALEESLPDARLQNQPVPVVRFPCWHYCHQCGGMEFVPLFGGRQRCAGRRFEQRTCADRSLKQRPFLIPMRFVAVCENGHIQDFPFLEWVHRSDGSPAGEGCRLRARAGRSSAGLAGMSIECSCGQRRSMSDAFKYDPEANRGALEDANCRCLGAKPWLGEHQPGQAAIAVRRTVRDATGDTREEEVQACGMPLRVVQRGASNVYFPQVVSSIYLPLWADNTSRPAIKALENPLIWQTLASGLEGGRVSRMKCEVIIDLQRLPLTVDELVSAAQAKLDGRPEPDKIRRQTEEEYRRGEYEALRQARGDENHELLVEPVSLKDYGDRLGRYFSQVCLVHKLRETRALTGFTRLLPPDGSQDNPRLQPIRAGARLDWLPAIVVRGEGWFFEINLEEVQRWMADCPAAVTQRIAPLNEIYQATRRCRNQQPRPIGPKFVLLHTLAHLLINRLAFDCGYGSASLRERLYCDLTPGSEPMQGFLIYTASGDAEGTMGGLVRQGRPGRLEQTLRDGLHAAAWCSSDPVCIESQGQGVDNANLAACHGCSLVPETSCEEGNRLLDRAMLVGTPDEEITGYFADII